MLTTKRYLGGAVVIAAGLAVAASANAASWGFGGNAARLPASRPVLLAQAAGGEVGQLAAQVRNLTGQVEVLTHQLEQLQAQLEKMQADNEYRFQQLEGGGSANAAPAGKTPPPPQVAAAPEPQPGPGAPARPLGTLTLPAPAAGGSQPLDLSALARGDAGPAEQPGAAQPQLVPAPTGNAEADYRAAYDLFIAGQYASAETAFRQFMAAYPNDAHAADASYWLGQSLFSRGMYREAAVEFVNGRKRFPKSPWGADTMLLLGKSLAGIPERDAACQTFAAALKQFPQMSNALRQRVITEQANAGC